VALPELGHKLAGRANGEVDLPTEGPLRTAHGGGQLGEGGVADDHHVYVAGTSLVAAGHGAEDKSQPDAIGEGLQGGSDADGRSRGLDHDPSQLLVDRAARVRLEVDVSALLRAPDDAAGRQPLQLALRLSDGQARQIHDLAQVESLVGV